jgi:hypothetical protein
MRLSDLNPLTNPFVVKALRARQHTAWTFILLGIWLLGLIFWAFLSFYRFGTADDTIQTRVRVFQVATLGLAAALGSVWAWGVVHSSTVREVQSGTLDFQLLANTKPHEFVIGKALGEPILAYVLLFLLLPFYIPCEFMGGYPFPRMLVGLLFCASTFFLCGLLGAMVPAWRVRAGATASPYGFMFIVVAIFFSALPAAWEDNLSRLLLCSTPVPQIYSIAMSDELDPEASVVQWADSYLSVGWLTAGVQVLVVSILVAMSSRLVEGRFYCLLPRVGAYGLAVVVSAGLAGACVPPRRVASFALAILWLAAMAAILIACLVNREGYQRYLWLEAGRRSRLVDYLVGSRSAGYLAVVVVVGVGGITLRAVKTIYGGWVPAVNWWLLPAVTALLAYGFLLQGALLLAKKGGTWIALGIMAALLVCSTQADSPLAQGLSPIRFIRWLYHEWYNRRPVEIQYGPWWVFYSLHALLGILGLAVGGWVSKKQASIVRSKKELLHRSGSVPVPWRRVEELERGEASPQPAVPV